VCGRKNELACPVCDQTLARRQHGRLTLDVCASCRGVWFDHEELRSVWLLSAELSVPYGNVAGDVLLHALFWAPDALIYTAGAAAHGLGSVAGAAANVSPEGAAEVAMGAVDAVGGAAEGSLFLPQRTRPLRVGPVAQRSSAPRSPSMAPSVISDWISSSNSICRPDQRSSRLRARTWSLNDAPQRQRGHARSRRTRQAHATGARNRRTQRHKAKEVVGVLAPRSRATAGMVSISAESPPY
jgi:hypothetical protein